MTATTTIDIPTTVRIDERDDGSALITLGGNITDTTDLGVVSNVKAKRVLLDIGAVRRINSRGVIIFMDMMRSLCRQVEGVEIHNAGHGFMQQYALIRGFSANARIESVLAAFHCDKCGGVQNVTLQRAEHFPEGHVKSTAAPLCKRCKKTMASDDALTDATLRL